MGYDYPILLDLAGGVVVIVGGGTVAARKARGVLAAGEEEGGDGRVRVRAVATRFSDRMPGGVERICEAYEARHLAGARLVFAATDDRGVNDAVVRDAKAAGVWVNRADSAEDQAEVGNFVVPAVLKAGGVIVSVSTGSAAVSAAIRDQLAKRFDPAWGRVAEMVRKLRPMVLESGLSARRRGEILRELARAAAAGEGLKESVKSEVKDEGVKGVAGGEAALRAWLERRLADAGDETK